MGLPIGAPPEETTCDTVCDPQTVKSNDPDRPETMNGWRWEDPRWREWTEDDPPKILSEALRRAVDIRDTSARQNPLGARPVLLVDVSTLSPLHSGSLHPILTD